MTSPWWLKLNWQHSCNQNGPCSVSGGVGSEIAYFSFRVNHYIYYLMMYANLWTHSDIIAVAHKWSRVDGIQKHFYNELWNELLGSCKDDAAGVGSWSCVKGPSFWSQPNFPRITMLKQGPGAKLRPKRELVPAHYGSRVPGGNHWVDVTHDVSWAIHFWLF